MTFFIPGPIIYKYKLEMDTLHNNYYEECNIIKIKLNIGVFGKQENINK